MLFCDSAGDVVIASMQFFTAIRTNPPYLLILAARSFCNRTTAFRQSLDNTAFVSFRFKNLNRSSFERSYSDFVSQSLHWAISHWNVRLPENKRSLRKKNFATDATKKREIGHKTNSHHVSCRWGIILFCWTSFVGAICKPFPEISWQDHENTEHV